MSYIEPVTGRYIHVELDGVTYRIAYEEAGTGIPLVCLHTAGADLRQYRHLLNNGDVTDRFRVIAFDLPRHGRSLPPDGSYEGDYVLTERFYIDLTAAFCRALSLERPALLGCSMGGYLMLDIAADSPEAYRALIALQPRANAPAWGGMMNLLDRPDMNIEGFVEIVRHVTAPVSPPDRRREVQWIYAQAGPGVLAGDFTYAGAHDVRERLAGIRATDIGLYVLAGDWDPTCMMDHTDELKVQIPDLPVTRIPDSGHFPPSENPDAFHEALMPILEKIATKI